jgi:diguanylate cyclase (GGDEF)-like protein
MKLFDETAHDTLTGLFGRKIGSVILEQHFAASVRNDTPLTVIFLDLDYFKKFNDLYGHDAGDAVLRGLAGRLKLSLRQQDVAIRWGGEEFVVVLPNTSLDQSRVYITRLVKGGLGFAPDGGVVTSSMGVAERRIDGVASWDELVTIADRRLYLAKDSGRNCAVFKDTPEKFLRDVVAELESGVAFEAAPA